MPNGAQTPTEEEEGSGGESPEEWDSDADDDDEDDDSDEEEEDEEEEVAPPRSERRSKLVHDPAVERGKATVPVGQSMKHPRTTSPVPTEKAPKQLRASSKPTKVLPKMKMAIPTISG